MKKTNACVFGLMALATSFAHAETYDATTGYVTMNNNDSEKVRSLDSAGNWSDGQAPHVGTNYYVRANWTAWGPDSKGFIFPATIVAAGDVRCLAGYSATGKFDDLKILAGGGIKFTHLCKVAGKITFLSEDAENPSRLKFGMDGNHAVTLSAKVVGSKNSQVSMDRYYLSYLAHLSLLSGSDWTEFLGTFRLMDGFGANIPTDLEFSTPGSFVFGNGCWMQTKANSSFGNLYFGEGSTITNLAQVNVAGVLDTGAGMDWQSQTGNSRTSTIGTLRIGNNSKLFFKKGTGNPEVFYITNRFELGRGVSIGCDVESTAKDGGEPVEFPIFRLSPEAVEAGIPDFANMDVKMKTWMNMLPTVVVDVRDDLEQPGGKYVYLTHREVVHYCGKDQSIDANLSMDTDVDQTGVWSDNRWPHSDADYYIGGSGSTIASIAFAAPTAAHPNRVTTFPSEKLCVGPLGRIYLQTSVCISNLHTFSTAVIYPEASCSLTGKWTTHRYPNSISGQEVTAMMYKDATFKIDSEIRGDGDIVAESYLPDSKGSTLHITGLNADWIGGVHTKWHSQNKFSPDENAHTRVVVDDGRSLGGALPAFRHDSLLLKDYAELSVTNSVAFAEETRGFAIDGNGAINVAEGTSASLCAPLTLNGVLRKTGGGVLSLGGALRFGRNDDLADSTEPSDLSNVIKVKDGAIKVAGGKALDGAAVEFGENTALRMDLHPEDEVLQTKGFVFTNGKSSLACEGRLKVVFDGGSEEEYERGVTVPLCTVATGRAQSMFGNAIFRIATGRGMHSGGFSIVGNDDGTETVFVKFVTKGLQIFVR